MKGFLSDLERFWVVSVKLEVIIDVSKIMILLVINFFCFIGNELSVWVIVIVIDYLFRVILKIMWICFKNS